MKKAINLFVFCSLTACGQSLILDTYIQKGLDGNLALKQQNLEIEKALKAIDIARSNIFLKMVLTQTIL